MGSTGGINASSAPGAAAEVSPTPAGRRLGPIIATSVGLVLTLAGTLAAPEGSAFEAVAQRVTVSQPYWLLVAVAASLLLAGAIFIVIVLPRPRPRRKKGEDDYEIYHEPRRIPPLLGVALILLALAPSLALTSTLFWFGRDNAASPPNSAEVLGQHAPALPSSAAISAPAPQYAPKTASPFTTGLFGTVAVLTAFGALAFVAWLAFGDRWMRRQPFDDRYRAEFAEAIDASLDDLRLETDARVAILKIYRNFERVLAVVEVPRRPWQTPIEFMRSALAKLPLPRLPVERLTQLFEIARFSRHPLGADERDSAWRSLTKIRAEIEDASGAADGHVS